MNVVIDGWFYNNFQQIHREVTIHFDMSPIFLLTIRFHENIYMNLFEMAYDMTYKKC